MADIFVSYKKEDRRVAERVVSALEAEGFSVWWDDDLTPRESWDATIEREAEACKAMVVLWTQRSIASDWVRAEAKRGKDRSKLVPLMMEACEPPIAFSLTQAADLSRWSGDRADPAWRKAVGWISQQCGQAAPVAPPRRKGVAVWIYAAVAVVIAGAAVAGVMLWRPPQAAAPVASASPSLSPTDIASSEPPLPAGPLGEAEAARRAFLKTESAAQCEASVTLTFAAGAADLPAEGVEALLDPFYARFDPCEPTAVLVEGHADAAERAGEFDIALRRAEAAAGVVASMPNMSIASFGAQELEVATEDGISLQKNRRAVIRVHGLPREQVRDAAYKALGLDTARDRSQPFARIMFGFDRASLDMNDAATRGVLENWRDIMKENPGVHILISGNVASGTREYAIALGERQASAVASVLQGMGVDRSRIQTMSYGKEKPALQGDTAVARMANRSVLIERVSP